MPTIHKYNSPGPDFESEFVSVINSPHQLNPSPAFTSETEAFDYNNNNINNNNINNSININNNNNNNIIINNDNNDMNMNTIIQDNERKQMDYFDQLLASQVNNNDEFIQHHYMKYGGLNNSYWNQKPISKHNPMNQYYQNNNNNEDNNNNNNNTKNNNNGNGAWWIKYVDIRKTNGHFFELKLEDINHVNVMKMIKTLKYIRSLMQGSCRKEIEKRIEMDTYIVSLQIVNGIMSSMGCDFIKKGILSLQKIENFKIREKLSILHDGGYNFYSEAIKSHSMTVDNVTLNETNLIQACIHIRSSLCNAHDLKYADENIKDLPTVSMKIHNSSTYKKLMQGIENISPYYTTRNLKKGQKKFMTNGALSPKASNKEEKENIKLQYDDGLTSSISPLISPKLIKHVSRDTLQKSPHGANTMTYIRDKMDGHHCDNGNLPTCTSPKRGKFDISSSKSENYDHFILEEEEDKPKKQQKQQQQQQQREQQSPTPSSSSSISVAGSSINSSKNKRGSSITSVSQIVNMMSMVQSKSPRRRLTKIRLGADNQYEVVIPGSEDRQSLTKENISKRVEDRNQTSISTSIRRMTKTKTKASPTNSWGSPKSRKESPKGTTKKKQKSLHLCSSTQKAKRKNLWGSFENETTSPVLHLSPEIKQREQVAEDIHLQRHSPIGHHSPITKSPNEQDSHNTLIFTSNTTISSSPNKTHVKKVKKTPIIPYSFVDKVKKKTLRAETREKKIDNKIKESHRELLKSSQSLTFTSLSEDMISKPTVTTQNQKKVNLKIDIPTPFESLTEDVVDTIYLKDTTTTVQRRLSNKYNNTNKSIGFSPKAKGNLMISDIYDIKKYQYDYEPEEDHEIRNANTLLVSEKDEETKVSNTTTNNTSLRDFQPAIVEGIHSETIEINFTQNDVDNKYFVKTIQNGTSTKVKTQPIVIEEEPLDEEEDSYRELRKKYLDAQKKGRVGISPREVCKNVNTNSSEIKSPRISPTRGRMFKSRHIFDSVVQNTQNSTKQIVGIPKWKKKSYPLAEANGSTTKAIQNIKAPSISTSRPIFETVGIPRHLINPETKQVAPSSPDIQKIHAVEHNKNNGLKIQMPNNTNQHTKTISFRNVEKVENKEHVNLKTVTEEEEEEEEKHQAPKKKLGKAMAKLLKNKEEVNLEEKEEEEEKHQAPKKKLGKAMTKLFGYLELTRETHEPDADSDSGIVSISPKTILKNASRYKVSKNNPYVYDNDNSSGITGNNNSESDIIQKNKPLISPTVSPEKNKNKRSSF